MDLRFKEIAAGLDKSIIEEQGIPEEQIQETFRLMSAEHSKKSEFSDWCYDKIEYSEFNERILDYEADKINKGGRLPNRLRAKQTGHRWTSKGLPVDEEGKKYVNAIRVKWPAADEDQAKWDPILQTWKTLTQEDRRRDWALKCGALNPDVQMAVWTTIQHYCMNAYKECYGERELEGLLSEWKGEMEAAQITFAEELMKEARQA